MPAPSPTLITLFVAPLNRLGVTYMVTGSVAAAMYGEPRLTNDVDLVVALAGGDSRRLHEAFDPAAFYVPPEEAIEVERSRAVHGHFNLIHRDTALRADIYLAGRDPLHEWALARRTRVSVEGDVVWVAPADYVVIRKLQYLRDGGSVKHVDDVRAMMRMMGTTLDRPTLESTVARLGLQAEWQRVIEVKG